MIDVTIPVPPVSKQRPRVSKHGGIYTPRETVQAEEIVKQHLLARRARPLDGDVKVELHFACKDKRRRDIDNLAKLVLDAGNGMAWADDAQIVELHVYLERGAAKPSTRLVVEPA